MELTQDQLEAVRQGQAVRIGCPALGEDLVLVRASRFKELEDLLEHGEEKRAWAAGAGAAAIRWAEENAW